MSNCSAGGLRALVPSPLRFFQSLVTERWARARLALLRARLLTGPELDAARRREEARSLRHGRPTSVAVFRTATGSAAHAVRLACLLFQRVRCTDAVGAGERGSVTVLLAETDALGAQVFASDVLARLDRLGAPCTCEVSTALAEAAWAAARADVGAAEVEPADAGVVAGPIGGRERLARAQR